MKKSFILPILTVVLAVMSSCSSYQQSVYEYSARQQDVHRHPIATNDQRVNLNVDYSRQVTASSDYQATREAAIAEAEYMCLQINHIDVVVDPICKIEIREEKAYRRYKATITGYGGKYSEAPSLMEEAKKLSLDDVVKYKLLSDPSFLHTYFGVPSENSDKNNENKEKKSTQKGGIMSKMF